MEEKPNVANVHGKWSKSGNLARKMYIKMCMKMIAVRDGISVYDISVLFEILVIGIGKDVRKCHVWSIAVSPLEILSRIRRVRP